MMKAYEKLQMARSQHRPTSRAYIEHLFTERTELHGDRKYADDPAIIGGIGLLGDYPVTYIGIERGRNLEERIRCNFGCPMPEGYRKALRLMKQAEKFHRSVVCFVDTSGAFCGEEAEERGQGQAIADNLMQMMALETPVITIVIGEGGSGGALGLSVANKLYMLENAVFSVISPEGCASILWGNSKLAHDAAACLHITAEDMVEFGVAEEIIREDFRHFGKMCESMKGKLLFDLREWEYKTGKELSEERYQRFRNLGSWIE
ncbi:acetyl-CoA carboxylase carboxyl transferase subunit alpha [Anaerotignum sp.]